MSTHTKGPWKVEADRVTVRAQQVRYDFFCEAPTDGAEMRANAALFSAAPEMLEALEFIVSEEHLDPNLVSLLEALEVTSRGKKAIVMVRRALAKARGEK